MIREVLLGFVQKFGPYLMLELLMPGGSLLAVLLFLYRRRAAVTRSVLPLRDPSGAKGPSS